MEHTISLHDSTPEPSREPFEVPSSYDAYEEPTPLHAFVSAEPVSDGWVQEEAPDEVEPQVEPDEFRPHEHHPHVEQHEVHAVHPVHPVHEVAGPDERRVVLQLTGGETVELRRFADADEAVLFARECVRRIAAAETTGEWPELAGRFLRPDSIFSVDVQAAG